MVSYALHIPVTARRSARLASLPATAAAGVCECAGVDSETRGRAVARFGPLGRLVRARGREHPVASIGALPPRAARASARLPFLVNVDSAALAARRLP